MKEIELTGSSFIEFYDKLKNHVNKELFLVTLDGVKHDRVTLLKVTTTAKDTICLEYIREGFNTLEYIFYPFDKKQLNQGILWLCFEEEVNRETFEEKMRRKQEEIFMKNCY